MVALAGQPRVASTSRVYFTRPMISFLFLFALLSCALSTAIKEPRDVCEVPQSPWAFQQYPICPQPPAEMTTIPVQHDEGRQPHYDPTKIWTTLLTNRADFGGVVALTHSLRKSGSRYQLKVMVTRNVEADEEYMRAFAAAGIPTIVVDKIEPAPRDGKVNRGTWEKLAPWSFTEYKVGLVVG